MRIFFKKSYTKLVVKINIYLDREKKSKPIIHLIKRTYHTCKNPEKYHIILFKII